MCRLRPFRAHHSSAKKKKLHRSMPPYAGTRPLQSIRGNAVGVMSTFIVKYHHPGAREQGDLL